ncbi:unnamed protein product, partial [Durusdinium trenchii]
MEQGLGSGAGTSAAHSTPRPPGVPPPERRRRGRGRDAKHGRTSADNGNASGEPLHGQQQQEHQAGSRKQWATEKLVAMLCVVLLITTSAVGNWVLLERLDLSSAQMQGFTFQEREAKVDRLPSSPMQLGLAREKLSGATTLVHLENGKEPIMLGSTQAVADHSVSPWVRTSALRRSLLYGLSTDVDRVHFDSLLALHLGETVADAHQLTPSVLRCDISNPEFGWEVHGVCVMFAQQGITDRMDGLDRSMQLLAQRLEQPAVFKWWPHAWGSVKDDHLTLMQSVMPATATMAKIK